MAFAFGQGDSASNSLTKEQVDGLKQAAANGNVDSQFNLGWMYATGDRVLKDSAEAFKWFRLAAEQGHPKAQMALGYMYAKATRAFSMFSMIR